MSEREDPSGDPVDAELQRWVSAELAPWRAAMLDRAHVEQRLSNLCEETPSLRLYRFEAGAVRLMPPKAGESAHSVKQGRADLYLAFFRSLVPYLPANLALTLCLSPGDRLRADPDVPIFRFQKPAGETTLLLPDVDFLAHRFYEDAQFRDCLSYDDKAIHAVFAGATTGGRIDVAVARSCATPRLRAAAAFEDASDIDFRLPDLVQIDEPAARPILAAYRFTQRPRLSWAEQFGSRFLISMDGNGATCSRVAIALASHSVLLKYHSDHRLHYFRGLAPGVHYVPIVDDADVIAVLAQERAQPGCFRPVAAAASDFARRYLSRVRIADYAARLITAYALLFDQADTVGSEAPRGPDNACQPPR